MDTTFGTYITDRLKLSNHRAARTGVQHRHQISPLDPQPDQAVTVRLTTPSRAAFEHAALYYTIDGSVPAGTRGVASNGEAIPLNQVDIEWDTPLWDYVTHWQAIIPGQPENTVVQYVISAWSAGGEEIFADWPNVEDQVHHATMQYFGNIIADTPLALLPHFPGQTVFNYHVDTLEPPPWVVGATIYHIFVDRFYPGDDQSWTQTADLDDICGGTLWGVRDKLDYLAELGVDCLWLSPTWASPSHHGYDITDYDHVEPRLGGDGALRAVVDGAHQRGMRVLLDMVCNHLSSEHPIFVDARQNAQSPYRNWFYFDERLPNGYKSFFGVSTMPRLNLDYPPARDWMVANAVHWLREFDVDGYRLDVADGPGPNFWPYFRAACRAAKADCLLFGEIIDTPQRLRTYTGRLDGCLDFPLNDALRRTFAWETMTETELEAFTTTHLNYYPPNFVAPIFLDNHDMNRFPHIAAYNRQKLQRALLWLMAMPQPVILYYGTEVGVTQPADISEAGYGVCRALMRWDAERDEELLANVRTLIQTRRSQRRG